ncbi:gliding motility-associated C-terminal domain-containing protein [Flavobacterium resistens]|uniref:Gliding motility-associated C-terminal domain-containing protein n=1 Tax=Flavobacterium resistens TaxID=443612 RepID=A0A521BJ84_9FLAO|nr:gliding motility-associated C-terminal domain-containing protein [Flavobacterium resistens]MRX67410.1 T9SS type B sorting domain-containing protein [Flavobacterium resistens]SMO47204.1 gliding motility-associated C-terminal domain-containing protein [Flavobacterium resistens]
MVKKYISFLRIILFLFFLSVVPNKIYAQCAGEDGTLTVCDIPAASSKAIDLYAQLTGSPLSGGVWTDINGSGGLDPDTGILDAQQIRRSGIFRYLYTVDGIGLCPDNTAVVTVTIGGYAGVPSNTVICSSSKTYNLFQSFNGLFLGPQSNGQWHDNTTKKDIPSIIDVIELEGNYSFTYTMPARGSCAAVSSTVIISVFRKPESGDGSNLRLCATDGLSGYTNVDLNGLLKDQDPDGTWTDESATGELTFGGDHFVDAQKLYTKFGAGKYDYKYTVLSTKNPICTNSETTVSIIIENKLDFSGAKFTVNSDICETEISTAVYTGVIDRGTAVIPDGNYRASFVVSGSNNASESFSASFVNGIMTFPIKSEYFPKVGNYTITITDIYLESSSRACNNIINSLKDLLSVYPIPDLIGARIEPVQACQNTASLITISEATRVADGIYDISYNIAGVNNISGQTARVTFAGGIASFTLPAILNSQSGNSVITITNIKHIGTSCSNTANLRGNTIVNPLPNVTNLKIQATTVCFGSAVTASVTGLGTLTDVTLSYTLSGANTATVQTIALSPISGNASFVIPETLLANTGSTTIKIENVKNNITGCDSPVSTVSAAFSINPIPVAPVSTDQSFCKSEGAIIGNLAPSGPQFKWYNSATLTTPLANTYLLKDETYYVTETTLSCTSSATMIKVTIKDTPAPELNTDGQNFCGLDAPTLASLSNNTNVPSSVVWYDAPKGGTLLPPTTALVDKGKYYGFDFSSSENCLSYESLEVIVSLTDCDTVPPDFFIPDGFSPNGDGVNDTFVIPNIDFLFPDYYLQIFNRYGNRMYEGFKDKASWDGTNWETGGFTHGIAPNGVYFYTLQFNKGNKPPIQGRLYLNR